MALSTTNGFLRSQTFKGLATGVLATQALDWVSIALYENESRRTWFAENKARRFKHVYEVAIDKMARRGGVKLSRKQLGLWGWRFHKAFGYSTGFAYLALRRKFPKIGWANGLAFGAGFFLLVDELMMPLLGWSPGPRKFSWKVHARGALSHIAYGIAAETTLRLFERGERKFA